MSICVPCQKTSLIPRCSQVITIGNIGLINNDVNIFIKDISTEKLLLIAETSDSNGDVSFTNDCGFMPFHSYELWITLAEDNIQDNLEITMINDSYPVIGDSYYCLALRFTDVKDCNGEQVEFPYYTIETI